MFIKDNIPLIFDTTGRNLGLVMNYKYNWNDHTHKLKIDIKSKLNTYR
jgi:hypothetical protein